MKLSGLDYAVIRYTTVKLNLPVYKVNTDVCSDRALTVMLIIDRVN